MKKLGLLLLVPFMANAQFWTEKATGFSEAARGIRDISVVNNDVIWAIPYDGSGSNANVQEFTYSVDGGDEWDYGTMDLGNSGLGIAQIFGISSSTAYVVAYPQAAGQTGGIWKTSNEGTTWTRQNSAAFDNSNSFSNVVHFWDENNGFCQGDPVDGYFELYTTTDGGDNWTRVPEANIPAPKSGEYGYVGQVFSAGNRIWFTTNKGRIYRSDDKGNNFEVFQSPVSDFSGESTQTTMSFTNENKGILVSTDGNMWKSNDGGETWETFTPSSGTMFTGDVVYVPNSSQIISTAVNSDGPVGSSYSLNGGMDWVLIDTIQHTNALDFISSSVGFSGGFNVTATEGGIFKYTGIELSNEEVENEQLTTISPKVVTTLLHVKSDKLIENIEIYNSKGQLTFTTPINSTEKSLNLGELNSGVYFVKIKNQNNIFVYDKFVKR
jgi:photosystem II stability/assembly factor-like uncharacterized protein